MRVDRVRRLLGERTLPLHVGNVSVALSVVALLGVSPRLLEPPAFVNLSAAWTVTAIFGFGLATPVEQALTRRGGAGVFGERPRPAGFLLIAAMLTIAGASVVLSGAASLTVAAGVMGWALLAPCRGRLAGQGELRHYARLQVLESVTRFALVAVTPLGWLPPGPLLEAAVGIPLLVSGLAGLRYLRRSANDILQSSTTPPAYERAAFVGVAVAYQVIMNGAPVVLAATLDPRDAATVGSFAVANAVYRSPSVLAAGFVTHGLSTLSSAWARQDVDAFRTTLRALLTRAIVLTGLAALALLAIGRMITQVILGRPALLSWWVLTVLAVSTTVAVGCLVLTSAHFASGRPLRALASWGPGIVVVLAGTLVDRELGVLAVVSLLAAPAFVAGALWVTLPDAGHPGGAVSAHG